AIAAGGAGGIVAYPGMSIHDPGAAEGMLGFARDKARAGALFCQMVGGADAGNASPDDQHVKVLGLLRHAGSGHYRVGHRVSAFFLQIPGNLAYSERDYSGAWRAPTVAIAEPAWKIR